MAQGPFKAALDTFLKMLARLDKWERPHIKALGVGLSELRWTAGKIEHRIIGYGIADDHDGKHRYVMLIGCTHKQKNYIPPEALETARGRKMDIKNGVVKVSEYSLISGR